MKSTSRLFLILATFSLPLLPSHSYESEKLTIQRPLVRQVGVSVPLNPYPVSVATTSAVPLTAQSVMVEDVDSGRVLYQKNPDKKLFPASTTKLMTALVALDLYKKDEIVTVKVLNTEGSLAGLFLGERLTLPSILTAALVSSGNDAAYAIATGKISLEQFINSMNQKAKQLSMNNTHFTNPAGLHNENHYSSARDLAELGKVALQDPLLKDIVSIPQITISNVEKTHWHPLTSTNQLLGVDGIEGIKTGWTQEAGGVLIAYSVADGRQIVSVVSESEDRFKDTQVLLNYIFSSYRW